ncbi:MAG: hypothetical protein L0210_07775 [Rhodospirillales bacterium]|nr:hypothetical protein [Rhodospirillales bacterium]
MIGNVAFVFVAFWLVGAVAFAAERTRLPGTGVELTPPAGMVPSDEFAGFVNPANGSAMLVAQLPVSWTEFPDFLATMSDSVLARQGLRRVGRHTLPEGVAGNVLITAEHSQHGIPFERWIYLAPGELALAMITVQMPQQFATEAAALAARASLASVRVSAEPAGRNDPVTIASLPFTIAESSRFALRTVLAGNTVMLRAIHQREGTEAILLISKSLARGGQDHLETSTRALETLEGVERISIDDAYAEIAVGDLPGIELTARCAESASGEPCFAYQLTLFDTGAYYRVLGLTHADLAAAYLPEFKRIAHSLTPK